jgi:hypothetical protein
MDSRLRGNDKVILCLSFPSGKSNSSMLKEDWIPACAGMTEGGML